MADFGDKVANSRNVAIEEALVELYAAQQTGNWAELAERYGAAAGLSSVNGVDNQDAETLQREAEGILKRFAGVIRRVLNRLFGRDTQKAETVAAMSDSEVLFMLAQISTANELGFDNSGKRFSFADNANKVIKAAIGSQKDLTRLAGNKWADSLGIQLQFLGRRQITEIYGNDLDGLKEYERLTELFAADGNMAAIEADKTVREWGKLKKDDAKALADLMHDATLVKIDADSGNADVARQRLNRIQGALDKANTALQRAQETLKGANQKIGRAETVWKKAEAKRRKAAFVSAALEEEMDRKAVFNDSDESKINLVLTSNCAQI